MILLYILLLYMIILYYIIIIVTIIIVIRQETLCINKFVTILLKRDERNVRIYIYISYIIEY